jgi:NAD(P)-dependent dehydrogenase (short-subunit alcohol dehydrogenase family)
MIPGPQTVALVTGASRGFGFAVAAALGAAGAQVIGVARTVGGLEDLADALEAAGGPSPTLAPLSITDSVPPRASRVARNSTARKRLRSVAGTRSSPPKEEGVSRRSSKA